MGYRDSKLSAPSIPIKTRSFIVGCPRSGTTLLQAMLASNTSVQSFPETHFFDRGFGGRRSRILRGFWLRKILIDWLRTLEVQLPNSVVVPRTYRIKPYVTSFISSLDTITRSSGKIAWIEKTPGHVHFINRIIRYVPDSKFIHIVKDGRAAVASLYGVANKYPATWGRAWGYADLDRCIETWNRSVRALLPVQDQPGHLVVSYHRLVSSPETTLPIIFKFLGIPVQLDVIEKYDRQLSKIVRPDEDWKLGVQRPLRDEGLAKYEGLFNTHERRYIEEKLIARVDNDGVHVK